jgi:hypothetical protein
VSVGSVEEIRDVRSIFRHKQIGNKKQISRALLPFAEEQNVMPGETLDLHGQQEK